MRDVMKHLIRSPQGAVGLFILVVAALMVCGGAHIAPYDPESISILARYKAPRQNTGSVPISSDAIFSAA